MKKKRIQPIVCIISLVLIAGTILLFSGTTSPLYPNNYGVDSAFNRFVGLMIRRGKVLYSEIWDNKGPLLFFIQALGTLKGTHNADVTLTFLMQIASLFLTVFFLIKTDQLLSPKSRHPLRILPEIFASLCILGFVMESGNLSEEWSLPMIGCSLYLLMRYAVRAESDPRHPRSFAFIHGICFAMIALIRVNNAVAQCAGLLVVAVFLVIKKQWKNLLENILFGLLGIAAVFIPVCVWFQLHGALDDMIYGVFLYNLKYMGQKTHRSFNGIDLMTRYLPILASLLLLLTHLIRTRSLKLRDAIALAIIAANAVMLWQSNIYLHYYIIFVPVFLLMLILYAKHLPEAVIAAAVCVFFIRQDAQLLVHLPEAADQPVKYAYAETIPEDEKDSAIAIWVPAEIYLNSGLIPCSRYAAYQFMHFPVAPSMHDEFLDDVMTTHPKWIIVLSGYEEIYPEIGTLLAEDYEKMAEESGVTYYRSIR